MKTRSRCGLRAFASCSPAWPKARKLRRSQPASPTTARFIPFGKPITTSRRFLRKVTLYYAELGSRRLGAPIESQLAESTTWRSRVIWPPQVAGAEFLDLKRKEAKSRLKQVIDRLLMGDIDVTLTQPIRDYLSSSQTEGQQ